MDPQMVPASNVAFVRTRTEADIKSQNDVILGACWPIHRAVIEALSVRVIICLGGTSGRWVRAKLGANEPVDVFRETYRRRWTSQAHQTGDGRAVVTVTHPSRAHWINPLTLTQLHSSGARSSVVESDSSWAAQPSLAARHATALPKKKARVTGSGVLSNVATRIIRSTIDLVETKKEHPLLNSGNHCASPSPNDPASGWGGREHICRNHGPVSQVRS